MYQPGESGNPNGRKPGTRNRRTQEIIDLLKSRGDKDPLDFLSEVISGNGQYPAELKITASNILAPYLHSKRGTTVAPRFVPEPISIPNFTSVQQAEDFLASISQRAGAGELDLQSALDLSTLVRNWIGVQYDRQELDLKIAATPGLRPDLNIRIEGGLPELPGTDIIMPGINGVTGMEPLNGNILSLEKNPGPVPQLPATDVIDQTTEPTDPKPQAQDT
jgi:hypothetical protein